MRSFIREPKTYYDPIPQARNKINRVDAFATPCIWLGYLIAIPVLVRCIITYI